MKRLTVVILIMIALCFVAGTSLAQMEQKIGYVNLSKAFDEYQKTKEFDKSLEKKGDVKQSQREKLVGEIRKMRDDVELLNERARKQKEQDIEAKIRALQEFDQDAKAGLTKERDDMVRDILKEMNDVIQEYGEAQKYSIILNDRVLLFGDKSLDITSEIIGILNNRYKKQ